MLDQKLPVGQDTHSNTGDGQGAGPELNKFPTISLPKNGGIAKNLLPTRSRVAALCQRQLQRRLTVLVLVRKLLLSYDFGSGNGPFGLCWSFSLSSLHTKRIRACHNILPPRSGGD